MHSYSGCSSLVVPARERVRPRGTEGCPRRSSAPCGCTLGAPCGCAVKSRRALVESARRISAPRARQTLDLLEVARHVLARADLLRATQERHGVAVAAEPDQDLRVTHLRGGLERLETLGAL